MKYDPAAESKKHSLFSCINNPIRKQELWMPENKLEIEFEDVTV